MSRHYVPSDSDEDSSEQHLSGQPGDTDSPQLPPSAIKGKPVLVGGESSLRNRNGNYTVPLLSDESVKIENNSDKNGEEEEREFQEYKYKFNRARFLQLTLGIGIALVGGTQLAFGLISEHLKETFHLSQSNLTWIATTGNIMNAAQLPGGIVYDYYGPQYVLGAAMCLSTLGWVFFALVFKGMFRESMVMPLLCLSNGLANWGYGFMDVGSLMTNLFNFPLQKGDVVIIQKPFYGLGSTFVSIMYLGFFQGEYEYYVYFIIVLIIVLIIPGIIVTRLPPYKRTIASAKRLAKMSPEEALKDVEEEQQSYKDYHDMALGDRRRLNYGVFCLLVTLFVFTIISFMKALVLGGKKEDDNSHHNSTYNSTDNDDDDRKKPLSMTLAFLSVLCIASFAGMLLPRLPAFFDFTFLPDLHPTSTNSTGTTGATSKPRTKSSCSDGSASVVSKIGSTSHAVPVHIKVAEDANAKKEGALGDVVRRLSQMGSNGNKNNKRSSDQLQREEDTEEVPVVQTVTAKECQNIQAEAEEGVAAPPIPVTEVTSTTTVTTAPTTPTVSTSFLRNCLGAPLWLVWYAEFGMAAACAILFFNVPQIIIAASEGKKDSTFTDLNVAIVGIGSATGRVIIGFIEAYMHMRNVRRETERIKTIKRQRREWKKEKKRFLVSASAVSSTNDIQEADSSSTNSPLLVDNNNSGKDSKSMSMMDLSPASLERAETEAMEAIFDENPPVHHDFWWSITIFFPLSPFLIALACAMLVLIPSHAVIAIAYMLSSISQGMFVAVIALAVREVYSVDVGKHYNFINGAAALGSVLSNAVMFGEWYDKVGERDADGTVQCNKVECYSYSLYVIIALNFTGGAAALYFVWWWLKVRRTFN